MRKVAVVIGYIWIFLSLFLSTSLAAVSTNVPLNYWSYDDVDRLIGMGLIDSALSGTRPYTRLEMARLIGEAMGNFEKRTNKNEIVQAIFSRLKREFEDELISLNVLEGHSPATLIKPLDTISLRYLHSGHDTFIENNKGDELSGGSNFKFRVSSRGRLWDHLGFYLQPEFELRRDEGDWLYEQEIREGYGKLELYNIEIEGGRDSLWWGPGRHGALFLTNNAKPYEYVIKISNPRPILLPWIFKYLGPFQVTLFWAELEKDRVVSKAKLLGQRINFKPHPVLEIGFTRIYTWGGKEEEESFKRLWDGLKTKGGTSRKGSPTVSKYNTLAGMDISLKIPKLDRFVPIVKTLTLYGELGSDDENKGGLHTGEMGYLAGGYFGDLFLTGRTDLRIEYAVNNSYGDRDWYLHHYYRSGMTYKGDYFGHHMGNDAKDVYIRLTHYISKDWLIGFDYDREWKSSPFTAGLVSSALRSAMRSLRGIMQVRDLTTLDLSYLGFDGLRLQGFYRYEHIKNSEFENGNTVETHIGGGEVMYTF